MTRIRVIQARSGKWLAYLNVDGVDSDVYGSGDSSVEAHCDLLERVDNARLEVKAQS